MYRQDSEFYVPRGMNKSFEKYIRHLRYIYEKDRAISIPYYDNLMIQKEAEDLQLIALRLALVRFKDNYSKEYKILIRFYYGEYPSVLKYAKCYGISCQAMSKRLKRALRILREAAYEELKKLVS